MATTLTLIDDSKQTRPAAGRTVTGMAAWRCLVISSPTGVNLDVPEHDALIGFVNISVSCAVDSLNGRAQLIFPEAKNLELVSAVAGSELPLDNIIGLEHEALAETSNIILNSCRGAVADMVQQNLKISLPELLRGDAAEPLSRDPPPEALEEGLSHSSYFISKSRAICGYIAMLMDVPSLVVLKQLIGELIECLTGRETVEPHV